MTHVLEMSPDHKYRCACPDCEGKVYSSVTTILGKAVPKDLSWWGMMIGAAGVRKLLKLGRDVATMSDEAVIGALKDQSLTVNHVRDARAAGGTALHDALEAYATDGTIPLAGNFPEHERGRVRGLAAFITTYEPEFLKVEQRVVSPTHAYAGTYDFVAIIKAELVSETRGKGRWAREVLVFRPSTTAVLLILGDLKTSKWVYPASHFAQIEAYEAARVEAGEDPTEARAVLHVTKDGGMELVPATFREEDGTLRLARFDDFLPLLQSSRAIRGLDSSYQRPKKAA